jgi:hypothetical protein
MLIKITEINDPEGSKGQLSTAATRLLIPAVMMYKYLGEKMIPPKH